MLNDVSSKILFLNDMSHNIKHWLNLRKFILIVYTQKYHLKTFYIQSLLNLKFTKGRVSKLKSAKVWSLTIEGGRGSPKTKSFFRLVFIVLIWSFSVQILKILSKKTIVNVKGGRGGQQIMVKDHTFELFNFGTLP